MPNCSKINDLPYASSLLNINICVVVVYFHHTRQMIGSVAVVFQLVLRTVPRVLGMHLLPLPPARPVRTDGMLHLMEPAKVTNCTLVLKKLKHWSGKRDTAWQGRKMLPCVGIYGREWLTGKQKLEPRFPLSRFQLSRRDYEQCEF